MDREDAEKVANQPTLADFGWAAHTIHESIQEDHNPLAGPSNEVEAAMVTYPRYDDGIIRAAPPNDPHAIEQTAVYLRDTLGIDPHPALWAARHWVTANNARLNSRLHAQTADFPRDKAAPAIRALTAAVKNQHNRRTTKGPQPRSTRKAPQPGNKAHGPSDAELSSIAASDVSASVAVNRVSGTHHSDTNAPTHKAGAVLCVGVAHGYLPGIAAPGIHRAVASCGGRLDVPQVMMMSWWMNIAAGGGGG